MALNQTWKERCIEATKPPQPLNAPSVNCTIGGNSPTEVLGIIENTPGNTWMNKPLGSVYKEPGSASKTGQLENPYDWVRASSLYPAGANIPSL